MFSRHNRLLLLHGQVLPIHVLELNHQNFLNNNVAIQQVLFPMVQAHV